MNNLKKLLALLLALVMCLALAACGGDTAGDTTEETSDAASTGDTAETDDTAETEDTAEAEETGGEETASDGTVYEIGIIQLVQHEALDAASQGFQDRLTELLGEGNVNFTYQNANNDTATCATIVNGFVSSDVDLILANATAALQSAAAATDSIPILGTSITDYATALDIADWTGVSGRNISGTSDLAPLDQQAEMLSELFPVDTHPNVGVLYCSAEPNSAYQYNVISGYLTEMGYTVTAYTFSDSNDVASVTTNACASSDVLYIPTDNTAASCTEAINNVALPAGVPIIAGEEGICAGCGVATLSISYYDIGALAGDMAYDILVNGADVSTMEVQTAPEVTKKYNASICEQLGITVPEDYVAIETE